MVDNKVKQAAMDVVELIKLFGLAKHSKKSLAIMLFASSICLTSCQEQTVSDNTSSITESDSDDKLEIRPNPIAAGEIGLSATQLEAIVKEVMLEQYGSEYDDKHACWPYTSSESAAYCMKSSSPKLIDSKHGKVLYFYAANRSDINGDPNYSYGHAEPGIMGAYKLSIDKSGVWKYLSASKAMTFGSSGYCGCDSAVFSKFGNDYFGWIFTSGGVWQGTVVSDYAIVAPKDSVFADLSQIPEIREENQDVKYQVKIIDASTDKVFPLLVTKTKAGKPSEEKIISFDEQTWLYSFPQDF